VEIPDVRVGQVWADSDKRSAGRHLLVDLIVGDKARVLLCTADGQVIRANGKATVSAIRLDRFRPTSTGYRFVRDVLTSEGS
jgi:hypothetical protein